MFKELNITQVFDLRSDVEIQKYNTPLPEIDGVEITRTPVFKTVDYSPEMMAKYVRAHFLRRNVQQGVYLPCDSFTQEIPALRQWQDRSEKQLYIHATHSDTHV